MVFTGFGGARSGGGGTVIDNRTRSGQANPLINKMMEGGGLNALSGSDKLRAKELLTPDEYSKYALGKDPAGAAAGASGGAGGAGGAGSIDANSLMELYQKGLGAGASGQASTDDQIKLLREGNKLDLERKTAEQSLQMEGQKQALEQTQQARAKERETEDNLRNRQQRTEMGSAMAAFRGL